MESASCSIEGCDKPVHVKSRGWCRDHYGRWYRHGDPLGGQPERIRGGKDGWRERYEVDPETGCWNWTGSLDKKGYGQYDVYAGDGGPRKNWRAHRYVYFELVRKLDEDEVLDHLCRNRRCVNPDHLDPVTQQVNSDRGNVGAGKPRKTHCKHGHEFTPENTIIVTATGGRQCRECTRVTSAASQRRYRARQKAELEALRAFRDGTIE